MGGDTAGHAYTTVKFTDCHPITWDYIPSSARYQIECPLRWNPSVPVSYVGRWLLFGPVEIPAPFAKTKRPERPINSTGLIEPASPVALAVRATTSRHGEV